MISADSVCRFESAKLLSVGRPHPRLATTTAAWVMGRCDWLAGNAVAAGTENGKTDSRLRVVPAERRCFRYKTHIVRGC